GRAARAAVPRRPREHVVAVRKGGDSAGVGLATSTAHPITGAPADEAVGGGDGAADPGRATPPRRRPAPAVPLRARDDVVAVRKGGNAAVRTAAHAVPGVPAYQGTEENAG